MAVQKFDRTLRNITIVLGLAWMAIGCGPQSLAFLFFPFSDDRVEPKCKLAKADKEVTVIIAPHFEVIEVRPEVLPTAQELAEALSQELSKRSKENSEKIKIVPQTRVATALNNVRTWDGPDLVKVGEKYKADYVIHLGIHNVSLVMPNSFNSLYQGKADMDVKVYDVRAKAEDADGPLYSFPFHCDFPTGGPRDFSGTPAQFRRMFTARMARDLARQFTAFPKDERFDLDTFDQR